MAADSLAVAKQIFHFKKSLSLYRETSVNKNDWQPNSYFHTCDMEV